MRTTHHSWKLATTSRYGLWSIDASLTELLKFTLFVVNCTRWNTRNASRATPPQRIAFDRHAAAPASRTAYRVLRAPFALRHSENAAHACPTRLTIRTTRSTLTKPA